MKELAFYHYPAGTASFVDLGHGQVEVTCLGERTHLLREEEARRLAKWLVWSVGVQAPTPPKAPWWRRWWRP